MCLIVSYFLFPSLNFGFPLKLIEVGTVAPPPAVTEPLQNIPSAEYVEEVTLPPRPTQRPTQAPAPPSLDFQGPGLFGPETGLGEHQNSRISEALKTTHCTIPLMHILLRPRRK